MATLPAAPAPAPASKKQKTIAPEEEDEEHAIVEKAEAVGLPLLEFTRWIDDSGSLKLIEDIEKIRPKSPCSPGVSCR